MWLRKRQNLAGGEAATTTLSGGSLLGECKVIYKAVGKSWDEKHPAPQCLRLLLPEASIRRLVHTTYHAIPNSLDSLTPSVNHSAKAFQSSSLARCGEHALAQMLCTRVNCMKMDSETERRLSWESERPRDRPTSGLEPEVPV